jgi:membrane dipeptidase
MVTRREFVVMSALAAAGGSRAAPKAAGKQPKQPHWPKYRQTLCIDGECGSGVFSLEDDDPEIPAELQAIKDSGLSGILLSVGPNGRFWLDDAQFEQTKASIARAKARIAAHPQHLLLVSDVRDLQRALREKRMGIIMRFQGSEPIGEDLDRVALFRELGVRVVQLTHNRRNIVGDGATEPGNAGLSKFGHELVEQLNAQKLIVDLAHGAQRTIAEGIAASKAPVLISHTGCRALSDLPRNTTDAELKAMADRGGVAGIIFWPYLRTDTQPMASDVIRHIEHALDVCGEDHVGIGTDGYLAPIDRTAKFESDNRDWVAESVKYGVFAPGRPADLYTFIPDLNMADRFDVLAAKLSARGHSDARIAKILGGNFARVMADIWG